MRAVAIKRNLIKVIKLLTRVEVLVHGVVFNFKELMEVGCPIDRKGKCLSVEELFFPPVSLIQNGCPTSSTPSGLGEIASQSQISNDTVYNLGAISLW